MLNVQSLRAEFQFMRGNLVITVARMLGRFCRRTGFPYASFFVLSLDGDPAQADSLSHEDRGKGIATMNTVSCPCAIPNGRRSRGRRMALKEETR